MDYSEYDLLDEFTIGEIGVACTLQENGSCDGYRAGVIQRALGQAILKGKLLSSVSDEFLSNDELINQFDRNTRWVLSIKIQRSDLSKWFESRGQKPAFLFKETRNTENPQDIAPLSDKERENLLKTIGLLVKVLADATSGNRLGTKDKPNASQITEALLQHIGDEGLESAGLGKSSLNARISDGLRLLS